MDTFDQEGMMEVFNGTMRVTPGISSEIKSDINSVGMFSYNSNGKEVIIADASGKAISLREMLLANASAEQVDKFKLLLTIKELHPDDRLEFSGFRGEVVPGTGGKELRVTQLESSTQGIKELNVQVEGYAKIDRKNKLYITSNIHVFINKIDIENFLPELLEVIAVGEDNKPLSEVDDDSYILSIANIQFTGVALTGLL
ncbi:MAG: hypothetical protein KDK51_00565 [Deltaproteobacteria bacterium]|nr:hypothetical protein [Deltaproteobacteria bacterium]